MCWFPAGIVLFWFLEYSSFFLSHSELFYLGFLFVFIAKPLGFWKNLRMLSVDRTTCLQIYVDACISFQLDSFCFWIMRIPLRIYVVTRKITPMCTVKSKGLDGSWPFYSVLISLNRRVLGLLLGTLVLFEWETRPVHFWITSWQYNLWLARKSHI